MIHKAVIDTNVLVSAFWNGNEASPPYRIYRAMIEQKFIPLFNDEIIEEYNDVLHRRRFKFPFWKVNELIDFIKEHGERISPAEPNTEDFPDPDDKIFYCVALATQDEDAVLVTGNAKHFPPAPFIVSPADFIARIADI
jgi:putative PIN family toxin of toxin-antitoxin system